MAGARSLLSLNLKWLFAIAVVAAVAVALPRSSPVQAAPNATLSTPAVPVGYGQIQSTGLTLAAAMSAGDTTIHVTDGSLLTTDDHRFLKVGMALKIESEQLLIVQINDNEASPLTETPPYADSAVVARGQGGTTAAPHPVGAMIKGHHTRLPIKVAAVQHQTAGNLAAPVGTPTTQDSGVRLLDGTNSSQTFMNVTDATKLIAGSVLTIDSEKLALGSVTDSTGDGYSGITEADLGSDRATLQSTPETWLISGACTNGLDDDIDGVTDAGDSGCDIQNTDGDSFTNNIETALGSNPNNASSVPEHPANVLTGGGLTCEDDVDNDLDGLKDGADPGCDARDVDRDDSNLLHGDGFSGAVERALGSNPADYENHPETLLFGGSCADTLDNDADGLIDGRDPGCSLTNPDNDNFGSTIESQFGSDPANNGKTPEHGAFPATCSDGVDNDQDGQTNGADTGCDHIDADSDGFIGAIERALGSNPASTSSTPESPAVAGTCTDGLNNDGEGGIDSADAGCNPLDGDGDTYANALETALGSNPSLNTSTPEHAAYPATCSDGANNDGDADLNGADAGCDGIDADGDGWAGAMERAVGSDPALVARTPESARAGNSCSNEVDDDGDALIDALDPSCGATNSDGDTWADAIETALGSSTTITSRVPEHAAIEDHCDDAIDNDGDGQIDADDAGCNALDVDADSIGVLRAYEGTVAAGHLANATVIENIVDLPVTNGALVNVNSILRVDNERMIVKAIRFGPDVAEVIRGADGTTVASHSNGAAVTDIDGLGGYDIELDLDRTYADAITATTGPMLELCTTDTDEDGTVCDLDDEGRDADCTTEIGAYEDSTADLANNITSIQTIVNITDQSVLRVGQLVKIDNEEMEVLMLREGPDQMMVKRSVLSPPDPGAPASHTAGAAIMAQNSNAGGFRFRCITTTGYQYNYGPLGDGTLGYIWLMPVLRTLPPANPKSELSEEQLLDISGGPIGFTTSEGGFTVAKCPDPNNTGNISVADWLTIARASLGIIPPDVNKHDLNGNNSVGLEDRLIVARIHFLYSVPVADCGVLP